MISGETAMTTIVKAICLTLLVCVSVAFSLAENSVPSDTAYSLVIVFKNGRQRTFPITDVVRIDFAPHPLIVLKDGHRESFTAADVTSMEFNAAGKVSLGRNDFVGKWEL